MNEDHSGPSELAHGLRERFRADHRGCDEHVCPFPNMHAEDIDEVLNAAGVPELRAVGQRAREIYADPGKHGLEAWRAARNILGIRPYEGDGAEAG